MKKLTLAMAICGTMCLTGCFSLEHTIVEKTGEEHVVVMNYGWKLFNYVPLFCGNATSPTETRRVGPWAFFRNDVTMEKIQKRFMEYAATRNREITELHYYNSNTVFMSIPLTNITIPVPYVICYDEIQLSGVLK